VVGDRDAADLGVVLGRHHDVERRGEVAVAADDLGAIFREADLVAVGLDDARLVSGRPGFPAAGIAQEDIGAPAVAGDVLAPAGDGDVAPPAVSRPAAVTIAE
jgi:hypothetical protein